MSKKMGNEKERLRRIVEEETKRLAKAPNKEYLRDLAKEMAGKMTYAKAAIPSLLSEAIDKKDLESVHDVALVNEKLTELCAALAACTKGNRNVKK